MSMSYNSDEDVTEASIYDLDHAPSLPPSNLSQSSAAWTGGAAGGGIGGGHRRESLSPRHPPAPPAPPVAHKATTSRRSLSALSFGESMSSLYGGSGGRQHQDSAAASSSLRQPTPQGTHKNSLLGGSLHSSAPSHGTTSGSAIIPPRRRAHSQSALTTATATTTTPSNVSSPSSHLPKTRSFPPVLTSRREDDSTADSDSDHRKVAFSRSLSMRRLHTTSETTTTTATAAVDLGGVEETKEELEGEASDRFVVETMALDEDDDDGLTTGTNTPIHRNRSDSLGIYHHHGYTDDEWMMDEDDGADSESVATNSPQPVIFLGWTMPQCFAKRRISWNRVATFVVEKAPCFLCRRMKQGTYRSVLVRLNILCACLATVQLASSLWFYIIMQNSSIVDRNLVNETQSELESQSNFEVVTNVWNLNGPVWCLGALAAVVLFAIGLTVRVVQNVNLAGTVRYLWVILWVIPLQVFWTIGLFDYFQVTPVWIKFWWRDRTMAWFRERFCEPDTANTLCAVPVFVSTEDSTAWCDINYNSTNCVGIRDSAQRDMERFVYRYYYMYAAVTILLMLLLFLVVKTLESIVSQPLVQKSRESNVPAWLLLPIMGCTISGSLYSFSSTSVLSTRAEARSQASWIGPLFILAGGMFFLAALLALLLGNFRILNTGDKRRKSIVIMGFILLSISIVLVLTTVFSACIAFSLSYEELPLAERVRGDIACFIDQSGSCSGCNSTQERCPEWGNESVTRIIQSQAKAGASLAAIFLMYAFGSLRYGLALRTHMSNYMIDYV